MGGQAARIAGPLTTADLSDGPLWHLLPAPALLPPRPPAQLALNEPETRLHPDLVAPLARGFVAVSGATQPIIATHAAPLALALSQASACRVLPLSKVLGEMGIADGERPTWVWPAR
jgi:predicted ATPase